MPPRRDKGDPLVRGAHGDGQFKPGIPTDPRALKNLGHRVARSTIAKILKEHGIKPTTDRPTSWRTFLQAPWGQVAGTDFFTTEVWTPRGLVTFYVLFEIDLRTHRVCIA